jgi:hypothetical protein
VGLKDYKIVWFTEGGWQGKVTLDNPNMRNDVSTKYLLGAEHFPIFNLPQVLQHFGSGYFDFGIVTLPKTNTEHLMKFDKDVNYYKGVTSKPVHKMPTLMLAERLGIVPRNEWSDVVIIGGNMVRWYGGFDSMIVAQRFDMPIVAPSMGRKIDREDELDIQHLPYMTWIDWMKTLSQYHVGVHLMPTHAAGTFALNCAFHGIPCIGYEGLDTQEELHPQLTVKDGDLYSAKLSADTLLNDRDFYNECSSQARDNYVKSLYNEKNFLPYITKIFEELIK